MPQLTIAKCCICLTILVFSLEAASAPPAADETLKKLAALDPLVGSWVQSVNRDVYTARLECKWILNKQFLEIDTHIHFRGHPASSWRTLITYDQTNHCYRQWKFSDNGVVSTEQGTWNEKNSALNFAGRLPNGNDSKSNFEFHRDNTVKVDASEFLDAKHTKIYTVGVTLERVPSTKDQQLSK